MIETTGLTTPLDQWVCASTRVARLDMLLRSCDSGAQNDYSHLNVDDALPLLSHACKTCFGDLTALEFDIKASKGPLAYSAVLTITGPDEIGIEFPDCDKHPTQLQAKIHAAYKAILGGAIGYIMQSAGPAVHGSNKSSVSAPGPPKRASKLVLNTAPSDATTKAVIPAKQGKTTRGVKQKAPPDALNLINTFLQRTYRDHKTPMPKSSQEWNVVFYGGGVTARLTIRLPSGSYRSYGALPGSLSEPGKIPNLYPSATAAKREVASDALKAGVLQFIKFDKSDVPMPSQPTSPTATTFCAHGPLSSYVAYDPSKNKTATGANLVPIAGIRPSSANEPPPEPSESGPISVSEEDTAEDVGPVPPLEQVIDSTSTPSHHGDLPDIHRSLSPMDEMEAVDDLLGPVSISNPESSEREEEEVDELASSECGSDREMSEGRSEPMELDSDAGTPIDTITAPSQKRVSPIHDEPEPVDEQPFKKQKTEPLESPVQAKQEPEPQEPQVMMGPSYNSILSAFCFEHGHAQPQVTYQRNFEHPKAEGPVMYNVSIILGARRFELSKQYESIELAEEKLSKRILRQFGVRAKKI
ncbi:unnamed protein product [Rhizoctonia solani]|uniref:Uncharacterized protein n=1 Tax=Rhizoctonia solani TaxID=456999 RepID=A0A8H2XXV4_9AGAM|nr:unnamed protein product [Rhizoctonia solani]